MINVKNPKWGDYPGLSEWIQSNHVALKVEDYRKTVRKMQTEKALIGHAVSEDGKKFKDPRKKG